MAEAAPSHLAATDCFKKTAIGDYVIKRHVRLFPDHYTTYRDTALDPHDARDYPIDAESKLDPEDVESIPKRTRRVRPEGVGHLTALAAAAGKGREIDLWSFKLEHHGHQFHFGFETLEAAKEFHAALSAQLAKLRPPPAEGDAAAAGAGAGGAAGDSEGGAPLMAMDSVPMLSAARRSMPRATNEQGGGALSSYHIPALGSMLDDASDDEDGEIAALWHAVPGMTMSPGAGRRWVPYRHTNGIAIYKHCGRAGGGAPHGPDGDEYMVSAVVRGRPSEALRVLMDPASTTTILGPAREVEVMSASPDQQVLRIQVQAGGVVGGRLAPREALVTRVLRRESAGIYVLLFSPVDKPETEAFEGQGVVEEVEGLDDGSYSRWARAVRCRVGGGFTISRLTAAGAGADSPECLVTLVLNVQDLGGWLSPRSVMRRVLAPSGAVSAATEALVERMLMSVMLVRDTVEQSRFAIHPGVMRAPPKPDEPEFGRSATLLMRRAASQVASGAAARPPSVAGGGGAAAASQRMTRLMSTRSGSLPPGMAAAAEGATAAADAAAVAAAPPAAAVPEGGADEPQPPCMLDKAFYEELHTQGRDAPFKVRGPTYLSDGQKVTAGVPVFELVGVELFETDGPVQHIARYLPSVRRSPRAFLFVFHLIVPGPPTLSLAFVYATDAHPDSLGAPPEDPEEGDWEPFDWLIYRFIKGTDEDRASLFKMIPHIAQGSWVIRSAVGTTPVIVARKLATKFYITDKYVEVCIDVGSNGTANYVTGMVRGATRSLVIDLALLLQGEHSYELPEVLLGACRMPRLDLSAARQLDTSQEIPLRIDAAAAAARKAAAAAAAAAPHEQ